jgi:hypothetical protein
MPFAAAIFVSFKGAAPCNLLRSLFISFHAFCGDHFCSRQRCSILQFTPKLIYQLSYLLRRPFLFPAKVPHPAIYREAYLSAFIPFAATIFVSCKSAASCNLP